MASLPEPIQWEEYRGVTLAMIAGYVDGFGLLTFKTYLSFMSGNTTQLGSLAGRAQFALAAPCATAIGSFVAGVFAGNVLRLTVVHRSKSLAPAAVAVLLIAVAGAMHFHLLPHLVAIGTISLAMGMMNTTLSRVGNEQVNLTFVTGTLNKIGGHLAFAATRTPLQDSQGPWDTSLRRALLLSCLWGAFLGGAVLADFATPSLAALTLLPPAVVLLVVAWFVRTSK